MRHLWGSLGVAELELRRNRTPSRIAGAALLASFPALLILMIQNRAVGPIPAQFVGLLLSFLVLQVSCGLILLLYASPVISTELEGNTWGYLATRPGGRIAAVLGKYLVAVLFSMGVGLLATTLAITVLEVPQPLQLWLVLLALVFLGCPCYAALLVMIGTWMPRRAMAISVIYLLLVEGVLATFPVTVNRFTVTFRLRSLLIEWMQWQDHRMVQEGPILFSDSGTLAQLVYLMLYCLVTLNLALLRARWGEYPTGHED